MLPTSVYGLKVPTGGIPMPAAIGPFPGTCRITMAAIDPSAGPDLEAHPAGAAPRATLKLIRRPFAYGDESDEDYDEDDIERIQARLAGVISDEDDSEDEEEDSDDEKNGGPSDPTKTKQARKEAMTKKLQEALDAEEMELDDAPNGINGTSPGKGKGKAIDDDSDSEDIDDLEDLDDLDGEVEEFVICTLDPEKTYQQTLEITIGEHEEVWFATNGTHDIYLTGNFVLPPDDSDEDSDEDDYGLDELDYDINGEDEDISDEGDEEEEDALDGLQDPRVTEVGSEDEAPKLVKATKKGKNKRPAEDSDDAQPDTLDDLISKAIKPEVNGEQKLNKKQAKKLKKNDGQAVAAAEEPKKQQKETPNGDKKKVQFAKNLEQGPTGSPKVAGPKPGIKTINGVTIDDKKTGKGPAAKKGDKIEMRYIGKLKSGKVFDSNKKGKPFSFKLGAGEVIKGWDIGIAGITVGGERRITVPSHHGYGKQSMPGIPVNSDLIFDVKCLSIN